MSNHTGLYTQLGRTGLKISRLVLGTVNFGGRVDEREAHALLDHAVAAGINAVDTANIYGWRVYKGYTEEVLGRWFQADRSRRDEVLLATKVGNPIGPGPNDHGLSARHIIAACEASLRRLRTDWIDLYQMHSVDRTVGWDEIWQAMELLVNQGKVRYVGSSNFAGWDIVAAQDVAARRNMLGLASEQCIYNLVTRYPELEIMPAAHACRIGVLAWSPLHGGLMAGVLRKMAEGSAVKSAQGRAASALVSRRDTIAQYEEFCAKYGRDPAEVGLAWVLSRQYVTAAIIGPRTPGHIDGAVRAMDLALSEAELAQLDELFPPIAGGGPGPAAWIS